MADDATTAKLVGELRQKLSELDAQLAAQHRDAVADFERLRDKLLRDVPKAVADGVSTQLEESMPTYRNVVLALEGTGKAESHGVSPARKQQQPGAELKARRSPPPVLRHTSGTPTNDPAESTPSLARAASEANPPRSPHEREKEFQGLFTPAYLPLLDSSGSGSGSGASKAPVSPPPNVPATPIAGSSKKLGVLGIGDAKNKGKGKGKGKETEGDESEGEVQSDGAEGRAKTVLRPPPRRRMTDDTTSSVGSDRSDGKVRRSALRRTSTASSANRTPNSPRRVRFEVEGEQVLPNSSPQSSDLIAAQEALLGSPGNPVDDSYAISSGGLLDDDDDDDSPPPKKVSSTQALRALSKAPLEAGTTWKVVNADPEHEDSLGLSKGAEALGLLTPSQAAQNESAMSASLLGTPEVESSVLTSSSDKSTPTKADTGEPLEAIGLIENPDLEDDEELLSMPPLKSFRSKKAYEPATVSPSTGSPSTAHVHTLSTAPGSEGASSGAMDTSESKATVVGGQKDAEVFGTSKQKAEKEVHDIDADDEEDMFDMEDTPISKATAKEIPKATGGKDFDDDVDDDDVFDEAIGGRSQLSAYATSPAVGIARHSAAASSTTATPANNGGGSNSARFQSGSVGSYRGRPLNMPVVVDPEVHARAALETGDLRSFVGGLDGRSGVDEGDLSSFRASAMLSAAGSAGVMGSVGRSAAELLSGTPRSFTERLALEDARELEERHERARERLRLEQQRERQQHESQPRRSTKK